MKAYVELIQRKERELGTDVLTHQKVGPSNDQGSLMLMLSEVERRRLRRQSYQNCHWRCLLYFRDGQGCYRGAVHFQAVVGRLIGFHL